MAKSASEIKQALAALKTAANNANDAAVERRKTFTRTLNVTRRAYGLSEFEVT